MLYMVKDQLPLNVCKLSSMLMLLKRTRLHRIRVCHGDLVSSSNHVSLMFRWLWQVLDLDLYCLNFFTIMMLFRLINKYKVETIISLHVFINLKSYTFIVL